MLSPLKKLSFLKGDALRIMQCAHAHFLLPTKLREPNYKRCEPYDYVRDKYETLQYYFDKTTHRFDDYSKVVVVDGPFGVGKKEFCRNFAKAFDFHYEEDPLVDNASYNSMFDCDMSDYEHILPYSHKYLTIEKFLRNPFDERVHKMQLIWFFLRYIAYIRVLRHILNTGQGVVINRSCFSFHCIVHGMVKCGFLSKRFLEYVMNQRVHSFGFLMRPHLQIYLEAPYEACMQRIHDRNVPHEANSKFFSKELHDAIQQNFFDHYLPKAKNHSELLIFDYTKKPHFDDVVMEVENVPFHNQTSYSYKAIDWYLDYEQAYCRKREMYTSAEKAAKLLTHFNLLLPMDVPEVWWSAEENLEYLAAYEQMEGFKYIKGYNKYVGDTGYLFKSKMEIYDPLSYGLPPPKEELIFD